MSSHSFQDADKHACFKNFNKFKMYVYLYCYLTTSGVYRQRQCWFCCSEFQPVAVDNVPLLLLGAVLGFPFPFSFLCKTHQLHQMAT